MRDYSAPLKDMEFVLFNTLGVDQFWRETGSLAETVDKDTAIAMLNEAAKVMGDQISPINRSGDEEGAQWIDGAVKTPQGFKEAYQVYAEGGWPALSGDPAYGGMGMPKSFSVLIDEMLYGANSSFALYPCLTSGATLAINAHASEALKNRFLPKMYSGEWAGTMCLTEPHAGSDLGLIRTKAVPEADGSYRVTGTKIFITGGDQDLTENIVHLVLAKLPDAPEGSRGISLFLVPKVWVNDDDTLGGANGVSCGSIEHKMGIKGSATCVMNFDDAKGYLVGNVNEGLRCMFTMMNYERLSIGIQGIGCAEMSYQNAVAYSRERLQGKGGQSAESAAPIIVHPDVRRMLLTMKSTIEAGRAMAVYLGVLLDQSKYSNDEAEKNRASGLVSLLTPIAKAFFTDLGLENTIHGQQVFGGHGYVREWGQEQLVRDVRIAQIYEGTNGIQALDLLQRKVFANRGKWLQVYLDEIQAEVSAVKANSDGLNAYAERLQVLLNRVSSLTEALLSQEQDAALNIAASATEYLQVMGYLTYGYLWLRMMSAAMDLKDQDADFSEAKLATGNFFFNRVLTRTDALLANLEQQNPDDYMCLKASCF